MTLSEAAGALFLEPNYATVTTLRADGSPHTTVVWVDWDGEHVLVNTAEGRAKPRHLRLDPRASVLVIDRADPYRWVAVSGPVELTHEGATEHIHALARRYRGADHYDLKPGEVRVIARVTPERITEHVA